MRRTRRRLPGSDYATDATLSSPQSSLVLYNDTLFRAPGFLVLTDKKEDEYESLGLDSAQVRPLIHLNAPSPPLPSALDLPLPLRATRA